MPKHSVTCFFVAIATGLITCGSELAAQATFVDRYQFLTDASNLTIQGGFGGIDEQYAIRGSFGLVMHQAPNGSMTFGFTNVRATLVGDAPFGGQRLDTLIGMSNWTGKLIDPATIDFMGFDGQGAPMNVEGTIGNVMFWLHGSNQPPCCDYFSYQLNAMAQIVGTVRVFDDMNGFKNSGPNYSDIATPASPVPEPASAALAIMAMLALRRPK